MTESAGKTGKRVLILIEDGSFVYDNRVKREAATLTKAGYKVVVICPCYPGEKAHDTHDGIHIYRYRKWGFAGHLGEYSSSLIKGAWLTLRASVRHGRFHCIHACNPPDLWFIVAGVLKGFSNAKFIFDHHDICPELYLSRFEGTKNSLVYRLCLLFEKLTFMTADGVISTNESYKRIAMKRGGKRENEVVVVRNGPILEDFPLLDSDPEIKKPGSVIVGYIGNMNPQDGVDHLLKAADHIVHKEGLGHFYFVFIGTGDSFAQLNALKDHLGLNSHVRFTGRIPDDEMLTMLNSCDICVQPDPKNPLNDLSTMNKAMEYMALEKPVVAYDLIETRYSCGDCALYANPNDAADLGNKIVCLANNVEMGREMGRKGRRRVRNKLAWGHSEKRLLEIYRTVLSEAF